jgi:hypothetical protein
LITAGGYQTNKIVAPVDDNRATYLVQYVGEKDCIINGDNFSGPIVVSGNAAKNEIASTKGNFMYRTGYGLDLGSIDGDGNIFSLNLNAAVEFHGSDNYVTVDLNCRPKDLDRHHYVNFDAVQSNNILSFETSTPLPTLVNGYAFDLHADSLTILAPQSDANDSQRQKPGNTLSARNFTELVTTLGNDRLVIDEVRDVMTPLTGIYLKSGNDDVVVTDSSLLELNFGIEEVSGSLKGSGKDTFLAERSSKLSITSLMDIDITLTDSPETNLLLHGHSHVRVNDTDVDPLLKGTVMAPEQTTIAALISNGEHELDVNEANIALLVDENVRKITIRNSDEKEGKDAIRFAGSEPLYFGVLDKGDGRFMVIASEDNEMQVLYELRKETYGQGNYRTSADSSIGFGEEGSFVRMNRLLDSLQSPAAAAIFPEKKILNVDSTPVPMAAMSDFTKAAWMF